MSRRAWPEDSGRETQVRGLQLDLVAFGIGASLHEKFRRWRVAPEPEKERTYKVLDEILTFYSTLSALDSRLSPRYFSGRLIPVVALGCPLVWRSTSECGADSTSVCLTLLAVRSGGSLRIVLGGSWVEVWAGKMLAS